MEESLGFKRPVQADYLIENHQLAYKLAHRLDWHRVGEIIWRDQDFASEMQRNITEWGK
jgi:hypothetical protein